jgi:hypothetical protein
MKKIWDAANVSLRWYEQMDAHLRSARWSLPTAT